MYRMLRAMFPRNRNQAIPGAAGGASPFSAHQDQEPLAPPATSQWPFDGVTFPRKPKLAEISRIQEDQMDRLEDTIERLAVMTDRKEKNGMYRNHDRSRGCKRPPFKPTITRHQQGCFSSSAPPPRKRERFFHREPSRGFTHNNSCGRYPSYGCPYNHFIKFDHSPQTRKPRVASRTPDQDRNRCYNCHEFGHFARECPFTTDTSTEDQPRQSRDSSRDSRRDRSRSRIPGRSRGQSNNTASFQFSNPSSPAGSDTETAAEDLECAYMFPFLEDSTLNM